jgi:hypothetical protein
MALQGTNTAEAMAARSLPRTLKASPVAIPPFCITTSIAKILLSIRFRPSARPPAQPRTYPAALWQTEAANRASPTTGSSQPGSAPRQPIHPDGRPCERPAAQRPDSELQVHADQHAHGHAGNALEVLESEGRAHPEHDS